MRSRIPQTLAAALLGAVSVSVTATAISSRSSAGEGELRLAQAEPKDAEEDKAKRKKREEGAPGRRGDQQPPKGDPRAKQGRPDRDPPRQVQTPPQEGEPKGDPRARQGRPDRDPPRQVQTPPQEGEPKGDPRAKERRPDRDPPRQVQTPPPEGEPKGDPRAKRRSDDVVPKKVETPRVGDPLRTLRPGQKADDRDDRKDDRRDARDDRKDDRKDDRRDVRDDRKDDRKDDRRDARDDRKDDRKDDRRDARDDRKDDRRDDRRDARFQRLEDLQRGRRERVEDGGKRTIIEEPDRRVIVRQGGRSFIRHDESDRFRRSARDARTERRNDGTSVTIINRPNGQVFSVVDSDGRLVRRYRRTREGREIVLIDNRRHFGPGRRGPNIDFVVGLSPPVIRIPRAKYIVEYADASREDVYEALSAPPLEELDRDYSLEEIRQSPHLRDRMRRVDLDVITFEFGSWEVSPDQYSRLEWVAESINSILERNTDEVFMIEGYTDAVGSDEDNLTLSDRRAESVAIILSEEFSVPPENLVTQGYGEQFLKVATEEAERANRRVAVRRITPLLSRR